MYVQKWCIDMLDDPLWVPATSSISNINGEKTQRELASEAAAKQQAVDALIKKYSSGNRREFL